MIGLPATVPGRGRGRDANDGVAGVEQVCAAIVTYYPDVAELRVALSTVSPQAGQVLIIDNATVDDALEHLIHAPLPDNVTIIRNPANEGLGAAINRAAHWADENGYRYLLLLDQDSAVYPDMVSELLGAYVELSAVWAVAAVGSRFVDARNGQVAPFVRTGFPFNHKIHCADAAIVECDFLISSGSLIPLPVLGRVGGMDESLFIDSVDMEWCFRARRKGYHLFGVGAAQMEHRIGDRVVSLPWGLGDVTVHSPVRLYYMMRNRLLLYRRAETPRVWIAQDIPRLVLKLMRLSLFIAPRRKNAKYMLMGLRDGWRGVSGPVRADM